MKFDPGEKSTVDKDCTLHMSAPLVLIIGKKSLNQLVGLFNWCTLRTIHCSQPLIQSDLLSEGAASPKMYYLLHLSG